MRGLGQGHLEQTLSILKAAPRDYGMGRPGEQDLGEVMAGSWRALSSAMCDGVGPGQVGATTMRAGSRQLPWPRPRRDIMGMRSRT